MTHALPIHSGSRSVRPLHMQFAVPLRTAESCWFQPDEENDADHRVAGSTWVRGSGGAVAYLLTFVALIIVFGGAAVWYVS